MFSYYFHNTCIDFFQIRRNNKAIIFQIKIPCRLKKRISLQKDILTIWGINFFLFQLEFYQKKSMSLMMHGKIMTMIISLYEFF